MLSQYPNTPADIDNIVGSIFFAINSSKDVDAEPIFKLGVCIYLTLMSKIYNLTLDNLSDSEVYLRFIKA
jgi:hypothetical protein